LDDFLDLLEEKEDLKEKDSSTGLMGLIILEKI
jgi:hypothetical protein